MTDYYAPLAAAAGGLLLAWATGGFRKYGHHLERLSDLAAKMPEGTPARMKLDVAVQEEATRLLQVPVRVRRAAWVLLIVVAWATLSALGNRWLSQGVPPGDVGLGLLFVILFWLVGFPVVTVAEFLVQSRIRRRRSSRHDRAPDGSPDGNAAPSRSTPLMDQPSPAPGVDVWSGAPPGASNPRP